ncbi:hypothetical protein FZEAL_1679 [Fusarium zealandicum]|uniref:NmrA-like domain-containing protein n=1 Tax=Fusarium zealandicum TaxID=1053134 RepID=A0A8H4UT39_9HYPO|nr:hypothetical protein FZEAL_1679 [Fusarium zealandicum]
MVKIALAGGSGDVAQEILEALVARSKHEVIILSRQDAPTAKLAPGVTWVKTDYANVEHLAKELKGVETVLSFIISSNTTTQRTLIDAAVKAGVKRFAPSEWASSHFEHMPWYTFKCDARNYLAELNKDKKVIEYSLFHPGLFTNYMTFPINSSKHIKYFETPFNFHKRHAILAEGAKDSIISLTTVQDVAKIIALAIEYEGEWPLVSGIRGSDITLGQLIALGEKIRGKPFDVEKLNPEDLKAGVVKTDYRLDITHGAFPPEEREAIGESLLAGFLLGLKTEAFKVSDEWNRLLPDYKFSQPEQFLTEAWAAIDAGAKIINADY